MHKNGRIAVKIWKIEYSESSETHFARTSLIRGVQTNVLGLAHSGSQPYNYNSRCTYLCVMQDIPATREWVNIK